VNERQIDFPVIVAGDGSKHLWCLMLSATMGSLFVSKKSLFFFCKERGVHIHCRALISAFLLGKYLSFVGKSVYL